MSRRSVVLLVAGDKTGQWDTWQLGPWRRWRSVIRCRGWQAVQAARRRTTQMVAAMSSTDSASSQPPSIHWKGQNRLAGW